VEAFGPFAPDYERRVTRKIRLRILLFLAALYFIAFLDRANVAYAKLTMAPDLGFSEWTYGFGAGLFFLGYLLLEIPGALIVQKWGVRRWTAAIMLCWGGCAFALGFIHSATSFYVGRFFLGVAEGGLFPGFVVYLSHWVPSRHGAGAIAVFTLASPAALALGGPVAGLLLGIRWHGFAGWRWLAILEALPAVAFAIMTFFFLPDLPKNATWLSEDERSWLLGHLGRREHGACSPSHLTETLKVFKLPIVLVLCAIILLANIGIQGFFLWLPTTIQRAASLAAPSASFLSGIPFVVAVISCVLCSASSDRSQKRALHVYGPLLLSGLIFSITALAALPFGWLFFWLCASSAAIYGFGPTFYLVPSLILREREAAAAVGLINMFAGLGGFIGPAVAGRMMQTGHPFSFVIQFFSACFFLGGLLCYCVRHRIQGRGEEHASGSRSNMKAPGVRWTAGAE
jgi:ACS family tartrate transporter-like MFS transporter